MPEPLKVLFVCTANICRSPYLELTARALSGADSGVHFSSAGTHGFDSHAMDAAMVATLAEDTSSGFASRRLTGPILAEADLVLTAEATHRSFILEEFPQHLRKVFTVGQFAGALRARHRRPLPARGCGRGHRSGHNVENVGCDRSPSRARRLRWLTCSPPPPSRSSWRASSSASWSA
jgi:protein-tyrosine-phosphatase